MPQVRRNLSGRLALLLTLYALLLLVCGVLYFFITNRLSASVARMAAGEVSRDTVVAEVSRMIAILLGVSLIMLAFAIGAYLFIGVGRAITRRTPGGEPTRYVDAWGKYRISDEQIRAATQEGPLPDERADNANGGPADGPSS